MEFVHEYINKLPVVIFTREDGSLLTDDLEYVGKELLKLVDENDRRIVFDLRKNSYLNSFGLGELINLRNYFQDNGVSCLLIVDSKKILKLFDMVGIGDLFEIVASENEL